MTTQAISARGLLRETFAVFPSMYVSMLMINFPDLTLSLLNSINILGSQEDVLNVIYLFCITPLLSGACSFYAYRSLSGNTVSVEEAFKQANRNIIQLILVFFLYLFIVGTGLILLIIPGVYLLYRLAFSVYPIVLENSLAIEGLSRSWELTKGWWWLIFRCGLLWWIIFFIPFVLVGILVKSVFFELATGVITFLIMPFIEINFVLLYKRLKDRAANI